MRAAAFIIKNLLVPVVTLVMGYLVFRLDASVKVIENQVRAREATRLELSDDRETRFKIYEAVTKSLESTDVRRQQIAQTLVVTMLSTDDALRGGLLEVLRTQGASQAVKDSAGSALEESRRFATLEQAPVPLDANAGADWRAYNVDVFWCTASGPSAQASAERVISAMKSAGATGRTRLRELPVSINSSPGYQISGLVIRREASEGEAAQQIKSIVDPVSGADARFAITGSRQSTPGYLSLFVCGPAS